MLGICWKDRGPPSLRRAFAPARCIYILQAGRRNAVTREPDRKEDVSQFLMFLFLVVVD
jgi:hypothetical protein